ncbi:MAG: hypothetical protein H0T53_15610 [Herpetosiphonaceae bacterium]|nr:hypothetical protein [Herpetosiphonaceae bacterium]
MSRLRTLLNIHVAEWTPALLLTLNNAELDGLAQFMGIAKSGTKDAKISRILAAADLRLTLSTVTDQQQLANSSRLKELRAFAQVAGTYRWSTKYGIAGGLLQWRNDCRRRGQEVYHQARQDARTQPIQLMMPIEGA